MMVAFAHVFAYLKQYRYAHQYQNSGTTKSCKR